MPSKFGNYLRVLRIACALGLIAISLWALLLPPLFPFSTHAIVNAKRVTLHAKDPGRIADLVPNRSTPLHPGDRIGRVLRDPEQISHELQERTFALAKLKEQQDSIDRAIEAREAKRKETQAEVDAASAGARQALVQSRRAAQEKVRIIGESLAAKKALEDRAAPLFNEGIITSAQWSETRQQTLEAEKNLEEAQTQLATLNARDEAVRRGSNVVQASDSVEALLARINAYEQDLGNLRIQRIALNAKLGEAENQLNSVRNRQQTDLANDLTTPIEGVVWRLQVVPGESVLTDQSVADIADTRSLFIEAYFRRDFMNTIAIGDRADVYLVAESRFIVGRVADIQVQEQNTRGSNAINTLSLDASMLRVTIEVAPGSLKADNLGQLAKVLTSGGKAGWPERCLIWLSLVLRNHR